MPDHQRGRKYFTRPDPPYKWAVPFSSYGVAHLLGQSKPLTTKLCTGEIVNAKLAREVNGENYRQLCKMCIRAEAEGWM